MLTQSTLQLQLVYYTTHNYCVFRPNIKCHVCWTPLTHIYACNIVDIGFLLELL